MDRDAILSLLMTSALELWSRTLDGGRSASTEAMYLVLSNPRPGDLVLEITTRRHDGFGRLLRIVEEPWQGEWNEKQDGPRPKCEYWFIETVDGYEQRWSNCRFIRVLERHIDPVDEARERGLITPELDRRLQLTSQKAPRL
jgi:hypothetical protein